MNAKELIKDFKKCDQDKEKWLWVKDHQKDGVIVNCDNDDTFITIEGDIDQQYADFNEYVGWAGGLFSLLEAMGIKAESV